eukprot:scaffold22736_cov111-Cylindrotheca_fusiformis.AAC.3
MATLAFSMITLVVFSVSSLSWNEDFGFVSLKTWLQFDALTNVENLHRTYSVFTAYYPLISRRFSLSVIGTRLSAFDDPRNALIITAMTHNLSLLLLIPTEKLEDGRVYSGGRAMNISTIRFSRLDRCTAIVCL